MNKVHVGRLVERLVEEKGMKKKDFAKRMHYSESNISSLFNREDWPISKVLQASEILNTPILLHFLPTTENTSNMVMEETPVYKLNIQNEALRKCNEDLKETKEIQKVLMEQNKFLKKKLEVYESPEK